MPSSFLYYPPPSVVVQQYYYSCWAAALEAWLAVTPNRVAMRQDLLIDLMDLEGLLDKNKGLNVQKGVPRLGELYQMGFGVYPAWKKSQITGKFLLKTLAKQGYIYFTFNENGVGHAVVIWGVVREPQGTKIIAMDPWYGEGQTEKTLASYLKRSKEFVIGWAAEGLKQSLW